MQGVMMCREFVSGMGPIESLLSKEINICFPWRWVNYWTTERVKLEQGVDSTEISELRGLFETDKEIINFERCEQTAEFETLAVLQFWDLYESDSEAVLEIRYLIGLCSGILIQLLASGALFNIIFYFNRFGDWNLLPSLGKILISLIGFDWDWA